MGFFAYFCRKKNERNMKLNVNIRETSYGAVTVDVPEGASAREIYDAAYNEYMQGGAWIGDSDFEVTGWEEE